MNSSDTTMSPQASFIDIPVAQNLQQMLAFDDQSFVYCAYRTLMRRDPDEIGMKYYLGRLRGGEKKMQILKELSASAEGLRINANVAGLESGIRRHKITRIFGFGKTPGARQQLASQGITLPEANAQQASTSEAVVVMPPKAVRVIRTNASETSQPLEARIDSNGKQQPTLWVDLTTSMEWTEGVVGIIRAELEIACGLFRLDGNVRFSMQIENGFVEIQRDQLEWLLTAENVADAYMNFFGRYKNKKTDLGTAEDLSRNVVNILVPDSKKFYFPFQPNDVVFAAGWMDSNKEIYFSKLKEVCPQTYLCYLIYDIILLHTETTHFYNPIGRERFTRYLKWISHTCDFALFGGQTAKKDTEQLQNQLGWPILNGAAVKFGTDIMKTVDSSADSALLEEMGIKGPFIITVGSIEPRKNHDTLYKAYLLALEIAPLDVPQLVICGRPMWRADDLVDTIDRDPRLKGKVIRVAPTDTQLAALYKRCSFTLLPSLYEGWSLTLPESLGQGKFCLCADTPPLKEIGGDLIDYAPRWDVKTWAEKIIRYSTDKKLLARYEKKIKEKWPQTRWKDTAKMVYGEISKLTEKVVASEARSEIWKIPATPVNPVIWMDVTTTFLWWRGGISGIIRTELNFIKYLKKTQPNVRFFAHADDYFFEVQPHYLWWLFDDSDLQTSYKMFQDYWDKKENAKLEYRNPFHLTGIPISTHPAYLAEFPANSIVFMAGIDANVAGAGPRSQIVKKLSSSDRAVLVSQLIYDFTPILYPHFHTKETCIGYSNFIEYSSNNFDHLIYGGLTAQRDGLSIQKEQKWKVPLNDVLHFGSNFDKAVSLTEDEQSVIDTEVLTRFELDQPFIITVGTIEPRKNHDMLYKAYVTLLSRSDKAVIPKLLFIGKKGWKSDDFLANFEADERVKGHVKILSPTDGELDVLYRRCLFTLLPSFYEGWSLTLPESLSHGKFCLTSDVAPLRETGRDLVEYINPLDTYAWADRIHYYSTHPEKLVAKEVYIKAHWKPRTWLESTDMLKDALYAAHKARFNPKPHSQQIGQQAPSTAK